MVVTCLYVLIFGNGKDEIESAYYENGFDFKYDRLPVLTLSNREDRLNIELGDNFKQSVELGEDYYTSYIEDAGVCEKDTYE